MNSVAYLCLRSFASLKPKESSCGVGKSSLCSSLFTSSPKRTVSCLELSTSLAAGAEKSTVECDADEGSVGEIGESDARLEVDRDEDAFFLGGGASGQVHYGGNNQYLRVDKPTLGLTPNPELVQRVHVGLTSSH